MKDENKVIGAWMSFVSAIIGLFFGYAVLFGALAVGTGIYGLKPNGTNAYIPAVIGIIGGVINLVIMVVYYSTY